MRLKDFGDLDTRLRSLSHIKIHIALEKSGASYQSLCENSVFTCLDIDKDINTRRIHCSMWLEKCNLVSKSFESKSLLVRIESLTTFVYERFFNKGRRLWTSIVLLLVFKGLVRNVYHLESSTTRIEDKFLESLIILQGVYIRLG